MVRFLHRLLAIWMWCAVAIPNATAQQLLEPLLLEDPSGAMTFAQVLAAEQAGRFRPGSPNIGLSTSAYWMRFTVREPARGPAYPSDPALWFDTGNRTLQEVTLYQPDGEGGWRPLVTGSTQPFGQRPLPTDHFVFPVAAQDGADTVLYLRVRSNGYMGVIVQPRIWQPQAYLDQMERDRNGWQIYMGMALALAGLYLLLWLYLREVDHLLYVLSLVSMVWATCSAVGGYGAAYALFWPDAPLFEQSAWMASLLAAGVFPVLFITRLAGLAQRLPRLVLALRVLVLLNTVLCAAQLLLFWLVPGSAALQQQCFLVGWWVWQPLFPLLLAGVVTVAWQGDRMARFIVVAYLPAALASLYASVENLRGVPPTLSLVMWGAAFELLVMALALADRFHDGRLAMHAARKSLLQRLRQAEQEQERKVLQRTLELNAAHQRSKDLLYNILPMELPRGRALAGPASATVLFTAFEGFEALASTMPAHRIAAELNVIFAAFDGFADECGLKKFKVTGDAYMAAAGLPTPCADHAQRCVQAGLKMIAYIEHRNRYHPFKWTLRIGIHSGPLATGMVGKRQYVFDIWADTVTMVSRPASASEGTGT
jgi:class 3 adenylate cyclase